MQGDPLQIMIKRWSRKTDTNVKLKPYKLKRNSKTERELSCPRVLYQELNFRLFDMSLEVYLIK